MAATIQAVWAARHDETDLISEIGRFRRVLFIEHLGWQLDVFNEEERDAFDHENALYCALIENECVVGAFRAIRCDHEYLAAGAFPLLASFAPYPVRADAWEISRFGVAPTHRVWMPTLYAVMLDFAVRQRARALVAITDLTHERLLRRLGIRTRRYGPPRHVGQDRFGRPLQAVAGEIPVRDQAPEAMLRFNSLLDALEISGEAHVRGPRALSA